MEEDGGVVDTAPHVALLPASGIGHLIPFAELADRLITLHGFSVTFITFASASDSIASTSASALLSSLLKTTPLFSTLSLPPPPLDDLPADASIVTVCSVEAARSVPALADALRSLRRRRPNLVAFVTDFSGGDTFAAARDAGVPAAYVFFPSNLLGLSLMLHLPALDAATSIAYRHLPEPLKLPGFAVAIPGPDLMQPAQDRSDDSYKWMVYHGKMYREADGFLVNTFEAIEPGAAEELMRTERERPPPVYLIGPMIRPSSADERAGGSGFVDWLDAQPAGSVLFVSFGSWGLLGKEQAAELALGLEMSGVRFLWAVKRTSPESFLPEGFAERTRKLGRVVAEWVPQTRVLRHGSTGGFLTHCGWNSIQESLVGGVPMIAWPLEAEQRQNAVIAAAAGVALRLRTVPVAKEEVARAVTELMEGEEGRKARERAREMKAAAEAALRSGGAAEAALAAAVSKWKGALSL